MRMRIQGVSCGSCVPPAGSKDGAARNQDCRMQGGDSGGHDQPFSSILLFSTTSRLPQPLILQACRFLLQPGLWKSEPSFAFLQRFERGSPSSPVLYTFSGAMTAEAKGHEGATDVRSEGGGVNSCRGTGSPNGGRCRRRSSKRGEA
ncbi:uncharacterized protein LOC144155693 [Haemaphysalis longicornis]